MALFEMCVYAQKHMFLKNSCLNSCLKLLYLLFDMYLVLLDIMVFIDNNEISR